MGGGPAYVLSALGLGWVAAWGSELVFWITPPPGTAILDVALAWGLYSVAAAAALSASVWSGLGGWRAAFLGGALLGFGIEGAAVATMYDAFPLQLVWTPLAWHALVTGFAILGGAFAAVRGPVWRQVAGLFGFGVFGAAWGLYWPLERQETAGLPLMLLYLGVTGAGAALAPALLSRLPAIRAGWWLWLAPAALAGLWIVGTIVQPTPVRLAGPVLVALTLWAMRRLGRGGEGPRFGPPLPWGRSLLSTLAPALTAGLCVAGWRVLGGQPTNIPIALVAGAVGLGLWLWLLWQAARAPRTARPLGSRAERA